MKSAAAVFAFALLAMAQGASLRSRSHMRAEPDTSCGKGFDELVPDTQAWFATASVELWAHPGRTDDNATFADELKCYFANMITDGCGSLPSKHDSRSKELAEKCLDVDVDSLAMMKMFSPEEETYFRSKRPSALGPEEEATTVYYKEALNTVLAVDLKEVMCLTLFTIDDECVKYNHIRM
mmetsp:Transcript_89695/g.148648  ORF Transcript_89695/g.148648 Transcript_89695/m.148648 type:complete len:181 (+) Transcript_89695:72-614(+)